MAKYWTIIFIFVPIILFAQTPQYTVGGFSGLNLSGDSVDIAPEEAVTLDNFALDKFGSLHKRYGYSQWDSVPMAIGERIEDIEYVSGTNGEKNIFIATNKYVYKQKGWQDTNKVWSNNRIGYSTGKLVSVYFSGTPVNKLYAYGYGTRWMMAVSNGDSIIYDSLGTVRHFEVKNISNDTLIELSPSLTIHDTVDHATYKILKCSHGNIDLSSYNEKLFVADSKGIPWTYDSTGIRLLSVVDTGTVDTTYTLSDTIVAVFLPPARMELTGNQLSGDTIGFFDTTFADGGALDTIGTRFHIQLFIYARYGNPYHYGTYYNFIARVASVRSLSALLLLDRTYIPQNFSPPLPNGAPLPSIHQDGEIEFQDDHGGVYELAIQYILFKSPHGSGIFTTSRNIYDSRKNFAGNEYAGFYFVSGNDASKTGRVSECFDKFITIDSLLIPSPHSKYYIVWQVPGIYKSLDRGYVDTLKKDETYFSQIAFFDNRLVAIGKEYMSKNIFNNFWYYQINSDTVNTDRVWFSEIGKPEYIKDNMNFNLGGANSSINQGIKSIEHSSYIFRIGNAIFVATNQSIYKVLGNINQNFSDMAVDRLINNFGIANSHAGIVYLDNIAYMMNDDGIWSFDGQTIQAVSYFSGGSPSQKISYKIRDIAERYRGSNKIIGNYKDEIYCSYSDSQKTLVLFVPTKQFTGPWDFGMDAINTQAVTIDSNYFLFAPHFDTTIVCRYPRIKDSSGNQFYDGYLGRSTAFPIKYRSGWQSLEQNSFMQKQLEWLEVVGKNPSGTAVFKIFTDHVDTLPADSLLLIDTGWNKWRNMSNLNAQGNFFQFGLDATTSGDFILSNYRVQYRTTHK
jgi:hypothetical protein